MKELAPNIPEVVEEVRGLFERYEQALIDKNVDVLDGTFWNSPPRQLRTRLRLRQDPCPSRRPAAWSRHQGKALSPRHRDAGAGHRHGDPGLQSARQGYGRPAEPDLGTISERRLEGHHGSRLDDRQRTESVRKDCPVFGHRLRNESFDFPCAGLHRDCVQKEPALH